MQKLSMDELQRLSVEEFKHCHKNKIIVVLDNIRSMHNVGSIFRTADAFRLEAVMLCGYTPQPPHRDIHKTALGATESVDWIYYKSTLEAITALKKQGYYIIGVEQTDNSILLQNAITFKETGVAYVLGNEVQGVDTTVLEMCDAIVEIPQMGTKHSLNVSIAAGIVLWEATKTCLNT